MWNLRVGQKRLCMSLWFSFLECMFLENRIAKFVHIELLGVGSGHLCGLSDNMINYKILFVLKWNTYTNKLNWGQVTIGYKHEACWLVKYSLTINSKLTFELVILSLSNVKSWPIFLWTDLDMGDSSSCSGSGSSFGRFSDRLDK